MPSLLKANTINCKIIKRVKKILTKTFTFSIFTKFPKREKIFNKYQLIPFLKAKARDFNNECSAKMQIGSICKHGLT